MSIKEMNRFFLLVCAPFLGVIAYILMSDTSITTAALPNVPLQLYSIGEEALAIDRDLEKAKVDAAAIGGTIEQFYKLYDQSNKEISSMLTLATGQISRPEFIFNNRISDVLGNPIRTIQSNNIDLKLYEFTTANFKGYALKTKLKTDQAMKMALGKDELGGSETTLEATNRFGAIAGVNAGGFADSRGKRYPLSNTVLNGKFVYGFEPTFENLSFVGLSTDRKLIGGPFSRQDEMDKLKPSFGATFVPVLLKNGVKQPIPAQWQNSPKRAPRTVIGSFGNDQLLIIVADGYDERGGSGATLEELQDRLAALRIRDAYNLDGGGSSSLVVEGKVINKPSDGRLRPLPTNFLFFK